MTISFSRYVRIVSGVGASVGVRTRDLIARLFSTSSLISPNAVLEFTDAAAVGEYFGTDSGEYARASSYFAYVSPTIGTPRRISFARYAPSGTGARIYGGDHVSLATLQLATAGAFDLTFNGTTAAVSGVDLSGAASLTAVAALVQAAIRAVVGDNTSAALVTYDAVGQRFVFDTAFISDVTIGIEASASGVNDLAAALGWTSADAILTDGVLAQTPVAAFTRAENISNNFGSVLFLSTLTITDHATLASLNASRNVMYQYQVPTSAANAATWSAALIGFAGTGITLSPLAAEYPEVLPMAILASVDYSRRDSVVNFQFKQAGGLTPSVTTDAAADTYDALRVNYYGQTQTAGQKLAFYQRGVLCGGAGAALDMNVYGNEQWLKDHAGAGLMSLLLSTGRVPANASGRGQILAVLQDTINLALFNGTISVGKTLNADQKAFVTSRTGDPLAWLQLQSLGYWVDAQIVAEVVGGVTSYKAVYTLLYSKDDAIRFVDGIHALV